MNNSRVYLFPDHTKNKKDDFITAMKKQFGYECRTVKTMKECTCACDEEKVLITLYKNDDPDNRANKKTGQKAKNPWTATDFKWGDYFGDDSKTDLHAIRADRGCSNRYKQVPNTMPPKEGQGNFDEDIDKLLFKDKPLLCCCHKDKNLTESKHPH